MPIDAMPFGERRQYIRKECLRLIGINDFNMLYSGHLRDLALGGAFFEPKVGHPSTIGQELLLSIPYGLKKGFVNVHAKVAWIKHSGIGVRFLHPKGSFSSHS